MRNILNQYLIGFSFILMSWSRSYGSFNLQLPVQSVPITTSTDVVSSNLDQGVVYNIM